MAQNWPKYASAVSYLDLSSLEKLPDWLLGRDLRMFDLGALLEGLLCLYPNVKDLGAPQET